MDRCPRPRPPHRGARTKVQRARKGRATLLDTRRRKLPPSTTSHRDSQYAPTWQGPPGRGQPTPHALLGTEPRGSCGKLPTRPHQVKCALAEPPRDPVPRYLPKRNQADVCTGTLSATSFLTAASWKRSKSPRAEDWIRKSSYIRTI